MTEPGIQWVTVSDLVEATGLNEAAVRSRLAAGAMHLTHLDRNVSWFRAPGGQGLLFYSDAEGTPFSREVVYRLTPARPASPGEERKGGLSSLPGEPSQVTTSRRFEQNRFAATVAAKNPDSDYWRWEVVVADDPHHGKKSIPVPLSSFTGGGEPVLRIELVGATDTWHHAELRWNGSFIGEGKWQGAREQALEVTFSPELLQEQNEVEVRFYVLMGDPALLLPTP